MKLEKWLYEKNYTTKGTSYHKIKANQGGMKALIDIFHELDKGNFLHFQDLINEIKQMEIKQMEIKKGNKKRK